MTPKEKANELYHRYYLYAPSFRTFSYCPENHAKKCALITVDEIRCCITTALYLEESYKVDKFWQEVRQEIEKL